MLMQAEFVRVGNNVKQLNDKTPAHVHTIESCPTERANVHFLTGNKGDWCLPRATWVEVS